MGGRDPQKPKLNSTTLMESLRKNPPQVRSINEIVKLLHVISAEQRSCNILRSCVDKVLMNMSNIRTLRDIIERLRSVSRTNGFRFELPSSSSPDTRCRLVSDMFSVKILLGTSSNYNHSPTVLEVSIQHHKDEYRSCPHLANIIRAGKFLELSDHLKGLTEMYLTSGNRTMRNRVFLSLQSLETDLVKMSQVYREMHKEASNLDIVLKGTVGLLTPRIAGDRSHLTYYVSPYDLIDTSAKHKLPLGDVVPKNIGLHAEVGIEQSTTPCSLPISPLIFNKHPIDSSEVPRFMEVSQHNSTTVQACFVLYLKPPIPVLSKMADKIRKVTGLPLDSDSGKDQVSYLEMLNAVKNTFKISMGEHMSEMGEPVTTFHVYHLNIAELKGSMVNKVSFAHPGDVTKILDYLRKQAYLNTLISSCIRNNSKNGKSKEEQWYFDISLSEEIDKINITLEHPLPSCKGTAFVEVHLEKDGSSGCKIYTGRGDPPLCTDLFVTRIIQKCSSIPITMKKLIEQSIKHPRKESELNRVRPPALFGATTHPVPTRAPNILTPVQRQHLTQRRPSATSASAAPLASPLVLSLPFPPSIEPHVEGSKKVVKNPMLARLLIPNTASSANQIVEPPVQTKDHPMLMGLLKENDSESDLAHSTHRGGKAQHMMFQHSAAPGMMGNAPQPQFNPGSNSGMMGMMSSSSALPNMDSPIPVPVPHQMPPPSYPFGGNTGSVSAMSPAQHSPASMQFQVPHSPLNGMEDITGPVTPTYPGMMSPGMISPSSMPALQRGRRGSRKVSQQSLDFPSFEPHTPVAFESQMSVESDASIPDLLGMQNRMGITPLRRSDSVSPGVSGHMPLQHTSSLKSLADSGGTNNLVRSISVGSGRGTRMMSSPSPRILKTPTLPPSETNLPLTLGSPPSSYDSGINHMQRGSRVRSFEGHVMDMNAMQSSREFFRSSISSTSPSTIMSMNSGPPSGPITESDADPFTFDDNKNPSKISMPESTMGGQTAESRSSKPSFFQGSNFTGNHPSSTGASDTLRELAKSKPVLLRALTGGDSPLGKNEPTQQRLMGTSASGLMPNFTPSASSQPGITSAATFDLANKFVVTPSISASSDKNLVRQNAVDKQVGPPAQNKSTDNKSEKTVKRRNSNKGEDGKPPAKKRGRPPTVKDHGGKRKKADIALSTLSTTQHDEVTAAVTKSIMLNIQLSSTGAPISSTTKTKPIVGSLPPQKIPATTNNPPAPVTTTANTSSIAGVGYSEDIEKYLKKQQELQIRKAKEKKVTGKASLSSKQTFGNQSSNAGGSTLPDKLQPNVSVVKPGSTSPRTGPPGGPAQKRPRKNSIKDVIEKLHSKQAPPNSSSVASSFGKQSAEKDANANLVSKTKSLLGSANYQKVGSITSSLTKSILKSAGDDKTVGKGAGSKAVSHNKIVPTKTGIDAGAVGKGQALPAGGNEAVQRTREFSPSVQQLMRKDQSVKAGRPTPSDQTFPNVSQGGTGQKNENIHTVLKQIMESAAATANKGPTHGSITKALPGKVPRPLQVKARSITPTLATVPNAPLRRSPSSQLKASDLSTTMRQMSTPKMTPSSGSITPPIKKSPSRTQSSAGGLPSRPSSASSVEIPTSAAHVKPLSSSPTASLLGLPRKLQGVTASGELQFIAPSISPTPKRTTSPQIPRTTSPLTRIDDKAVKGIPNRSPHRPSPTNSRVTTPIQTSSPQSPDDRLIIDDPTMPTQGGTSGTSQTVTSRDEQRPVFLPGNKATEQSPERAVMASPMSPPSMGQKGMNLTQGIRRASTPRSSLTASPSVPSISSTSVTDSPLTIDDDLMDQAVTG